MHSGDIYIQSFGRSFIWYEDRISFVLTGKLLRITIKCNTLGAYCSFNISRYFGADLINQKLPNQLSKIKEKIKENENRLFFYMVSSRLFPGTPNWAMNILFPHLGIKDVYFFFSVLIGLTPWNFITCKSG